MSESHKPMVVLRGEALHQRLVHSNVLQQSEMSRTTLRQPAPLKEDDFKRDGGVNVGLNDNVYGVPISAIQHCCGRGCKHCRIYWHKQAKE